MKNKIIAHLSIIMILVGVFCNVCTMGISLSRNDKLICYASADNWDSCDTSDLVTAFRYYCKSRNLALEGSGADALTSFTTTTFNNLCSTLGIDPTTLSAELKKTTEGNLGLRFLFSNTGITAYNRIFAEFLQNNDLSVGDTVEDMNIYSGKSYTDDDGNNALLYVVSDIKNNQTDINYILQKGTTYKYSGDYLFSISENADTTVTYNINNEVLSYTVRSTNYSSAFWGSNLYITQIKGYPVRFATKANHNSIVGNGGTILTYNNKDNKIHLCSFVYNSDYSKNGMVSLYTLENATSENVDIDLTTNNTTINNNTYNNNYVIIYTDGDTYISDDDDEPLPTTPPSGDGGGGGGGDDNPNNPDIPPVDPTPTPSPTIPDWDIELPEMPTGNDWLLYGLEKKFPWDIPFNLMYMLSLFAADPETPHFQGTLDFKIVQWDYDIDLAPFDEIAGYVRDMEFIGFLLGLMLLTRKLIWG